MFKSLFVIALRNLIKNKAYAAINVLGLSLGVACCVIIFIIVRYETSFDDFHSKADRIYRVNLYQKTSHGVFQSGCNYTPLAETIRSEVTGLQAVTGVYCIQQFQFAQEQKLYEGKYAFFADEDYFNVFDVRWIAGNKEQALSGLNKAVVTDVFAEEYLGGITHALGTTFTLENRIELTVTGVAKAPPSNTDHPYSVLISYSSLPVFLNESESNWERVGAGSAYIVFNEHTQKDQINAQLSSIITKYLKEDVAKNTSFYLMALNDNHDRNYDYSSYTYDFPVPVMVILSIIAGMIAFIACINFVNLATAQSLTRAREVGIRKTLGGSRPQLILQYLSEAFVITLLAVVTGLALAQLGMTQLNTRYGGDYLQFHFFEEPSTLLFVACITIGVTFLAGFYPAFILSGFRPVWALKSQKSPGKPGGFSLRRILVVLQFTGAQVLILVTIIIINQINHFKERPIGFNAEAIVVIPHLRGNELQQHAKLDQELKQVPGIINHSFAFGILSGGARAEFYTDHERKHTGQLNYSDDRFVSAFNLKLVAGKNFPSDLTHASSEVLVNQALVKKLGIESAEAAIGAIYTVDGQEVIIRGVLKDFYTSSMSSRVEPVTIQYNPDKFIGVAMNIRTDHTGETLADIEKAWKKVYPEYLCRLQFLDDILERNYGFFNTIFSFLGIAAFLAIFIGCLGLYGLVSFMAVQRTKEIGIRKVMGATIKNIMMMFTKESVILILIAFVLAAPLGRLFGIAMLMELPERVSPGIEIFVVTLFASLIIALLTVGYRSFKAAIQNPTDSLRTE
jgi:ABC-type antimicrobial peptide transport system permease subunit